ncbi:MAG: hypothetical protein BGO55_11330 [Sphingobacteriales bacterium 50-39]|nr:hypothetical protein [Sphingobacteriales bacterium]OJW54289.1 MAG: hypothetical protein BGO55_11330 [Sphingobacteriales bacterium 50-39]
MPEKLVYRGLYLILGVQCIFFLYLVFRIPFHYDESWSYMYFSGRGFQTTATFYPLPNNHILYNLVATIFVKPGIDPEIGTRLPSYFASFIATYYFFKLSYTHFAGPITLVMTALFASAYPFVLYSIEARGYSFLILFTVLSFYAADHLAKDATLRRYRYLYWISLVAGLYSMPSFIYTALVISGTLGLYFISKRQWSSFRLLVIDHAKAGLVAVLLYVPVVHANGIQKFTHPDGFSKLTMTQLAQALPHTLPATLHFLTGIDKAPLFTIIICIPAGILYNLFCERKTMFLAVVSAVMLVSPPVILLANPILPYPRTWSYLVVPLALCVGYLISLLTWYLRTALKNWSWPAVGMVVVIMLACYTNFLKRHMENYAIDYTIRAAFKNMGPRIAAVSSIGYTGESLEYYVAEDLQFQCMKRDPDKPLKMDKKETFTRTEDILILAPDSIKNFRLDQYILMGTDSVHYFLFARTSLSGRRVPDER